MVPPERTVKIGIETAANALRKFLHSGDSPSDCTAILSTINSELLSMRLSQTVQTIVQSFLESDLLSSTCEAWNHEKIPANLESEILNLFHLVTESIFQGNGDLTSGLQFRDSHTNKLVCSFYHRLYNTALESASPKLASQTDKCISEALVSSFASHPSFVRAFFDHHNDFLPYRFFLHHFPVFFEQVAKCLSSCKDDRYFQAFIKKNMAVLVQKVTWRETATLWDPENAWKLMFFCEVLQKSPVNEIALLVFELFLHSIDSWKALFEVSLYFLNVIAHNPQIDAIIAESIDTRMVLVMKNAHVEPLTEEEDLIIWDFICKALECKSFDLVFGLFYKVSPCQDKHAERRAVGKFRRNTFKLMATDAWYIERFTASFPDFCKMILGPRHANIEWCCQKSLSHFYVFGIDDFLTNSLITNRYIYSATIYLMSFDCSEVLCLPTEIIEHVAELLGSIDGWVFRGLKQSVSDSETAFLELGKRSRARTADSNDSERPLTDAEKTILRNEGLRQNFYLLEAIAATMYAAIRAKSVTKHRPLHLSDLRHGDSRQHRWDSLNGNDELSNADIRMSDF